MTYESSLAARSSLAALLDVWRAIPEAAIWRMCS